MRPTKFFSLVCPLKVRTWKEHKIIFNNIVKTSFFWIVSARLAQLGSNLTGKLSLTSHRRSVLSVDAEASSLLDKNLT